MKRVTWAALLFLLLFAMPAGADVFRPAYLELRQRDAETYDVTWKVPALDAETTLVPEPTFPAGAQRLGGSSRIYAAGATLQRWRVRIPGGLEGRSIGFSELAATNLDVLVRVERIDGSQQVERVLGSNPRFTLRATPGSLEVVGTYTLLGIEHILTGVDHLLFVLGLILLVRTRRQLLVTVTAFTLAHSLTLALATLEVVRIPGPPVEATIALSIVFVASEIMRVRQGRGGLAARMPWLIAFAFGLLHGLGFAGALAEVGLPHNAVPLALLCFNVGVEIGQLAFIAAVLGVAAIATRLVGRANQRWTTVVPTYCIGIVASFWTFERIAAFWG